MKICIWCLEDTDERPTEIGPPRGHQLDSYRDAMLLCTPCKQALLAQDVAALYKRYRAQKMITRSDTQ